MASVEHFTIKPNKAILPVVQGSSTEEPKKHEPYVLKNQGKTDIKVELIYGGNEKIEGTLQSEVVKPGEEVTLNPGDKMYQHTALKVYNTTNDTAKFSVDGGIPVFGAEEMQEDLKH